MNEHKSKCGICRDLIPLVKDDVASEGSREYVHEHIKECRECFDEYESYSALSADSEGEAKYNKLAERIKTMIWSGALIMLIVGLALGIGISPVSSKLIFIIPVAACVIVAAFNYKTDKTRMLWVLGTLAAFVAAYLLMRCIRPFEYNVSYWVASHLTFAVVFIAVVSAFFMKRYMAAAVFAGYCICGIAGEVFGTVSYDPGGGRLHNGWIIAVLVLAAFTIAGVMAELICDGVHIHGAMVRLAFRLFGAQRMILISDSLRAAGMPDGRYPFGGQEIEVHGNRATIAGHPETLAGSVTSLMGCLRQAAAFGIPLADAVRAASYNPAKSIKIDDRVGSLEEGKEASIVLLDRKTLAVRKIIFKGMPVNR